MNIHLVILVVCVLMVVFVFGYMVGVDIERSNEPTQKIIMLTGYNIAIECNSSTFFGMPIEAVRMLNASITFWECE